MGKKLISYMLIIALLSSQFAWSMHGVEDLPQNGHGVRVKQRVSFCDRITSCLSGLKSRCPTLSCPKLSWPSWCCWGKKKSSLHEPLLNGAADAEKATPSTAVTKKQQFEEYVGWRIINRKSTWLMRLAYLGGLILGTAVGCAGGILLLANFQNTDSNIIENLRDFMGDNANVVLTYGIISLALDAVSRNARILGTKVAGSCKGAFCHKPPKQEMRKERCKRAFIYLAAAIPSAIPVYATILNQLGNAEFMEVEWIGSEFMIMATVLSPFLIANAMLTHGETFSNLRRDRNQAARQKRELVGLVGQQRAAVSAQFSRVIRYIAKLPDRDVGEVYDQLFMRDTPQKYDQEGAGALRVLIGCFPKAVNDATDEQFEGSHRGKERAISYAGWAQVGLATPGRSVILFYAIYKTFSFAPAWVSIPIATLGTILGNGILGYIESKAAKNVVTDIAYCNNWDMTSINKDFSHNCGWRVAKGGAKIVNFAQGAVHALPTLLVGLIATKGWPGEAKWTVLLPFTLTRAHFNKVAFDESFADMEQRTERIISSHCHRQTPGFKRDVMIRIARQLKDLIGELDIETFSAVYSEFFAPYFAPTAKPGERTISASDDYQSRFGLPISARNGTQEVVNDTQEHKLTVSVPARGSVNGDSRNLSSPESGGILSPGPSGLSPVILRSINQSD